MRATVISMASAKGGSGKTSITAAFGTILASLGRRVLMVDTDAATNGLSLFFIKNINDEIADPDHTPIGLFEATDPNAELHAIEISENFSLLPATYGFRNTESTDPLKYKQVLISLIARQRNKFDFIFVDAQAGSDEFAEIAVSEDVSDQVVIVSEYDPISAAGVERLKALFRESLTYRRTWVLLNKMLPDFIKSFSDFLEIAKYLTPLPWNADVVRAYARRTLPLDLEVGNEYTAAVIQTLRSLLDDATRKDLDLWLNDRVIGLRAPIQIQLEEALMERDILRERQEKIRRRRRLRIVLSSSILGSLAVIGTLLYLLLGPGNVTDRVGVIGPILTALVAIIFVTYNTWTREPYEKGIDKEMEHTQERIQRLSELSDLSSEDLIRRSHR
jgi:cellulose biosynthesis protein BcsQ